MTSVNSSGAAEVLCEALRKRKKYVEISSMKSVKSLLEEAYRLDPRVAGCAEKWKWTEQGSGLLGLNKTYCIEIEYAEDIVENINDVILDNGTWKPSDALTAVANMPAVIQVVTKDVNSLTERISAEQLNLKEQYPGLKQIQYKWSASSSNGYSTVWVKFQYAVERDRYKMYHTLAMREMERISSRFFGKGNIPKVIRVFLVFSYLQQTCVYDQESADLLTSNHDELIDRPWVSIPYGALVKNMAICEGLASAFKMFMDYYGITNRIIFGWFEGEKINHCWNMVCLNEKYYHIDVTYGMEGDGIYIGSFLKDDISMGQTHLWNMADYPACTSTKLDYDYVENYINEHLDDLIRMGVDDRYLCPEEVRE